MSAGDLLRRARERAGSSQRALAQAAGVPPSTIGRIERGELSPTVNMLERLAEALGTHLDIRFSGDLPSRLGVAAQDVKRICAAYGATNPAVFGSVARGEDTVGSDLDLLVDLSPDADLLTLVRLQRELGSLLEVDVDVVPRSGLDPDRHRAIRREAVPL